MTGSTESVPHRELARQNGRARSGLTRIEVMAVLICLFVLLLLIVPGIFFQRETQRNVACQERMQELGQALLDDAETHNNRFTPLVQGKTPWTRAILPYLKPPPAFRSQLTNDPITEQPPIAAPLFLCPNGQRYEAGRNCYVVNGGWGDFQVDPETNLVTETEQHTVNLDWDRDGVVTQQERDWTRATGVIWRADPEVRTSWSSDELDAADGRGQTILLSETLNSRSWMSLETFDLAFVAGRDSMEFGEPPGLFNLASAALGPYAINSSKGGRLGHCPAPSSLHPEGVNILFADGAFRTLSNEIDPLVYLRLMTPAGARYGEFRIKQREPD
jgi:prepilin-type processing-associated H-X9-DG protein